MNDSFNEIENIYSGTEIKLNINIEPIGAYKMKDYNFDIEAFCMPQKKVIIHKSDSDRVKYQDDNNYVVLIDTSGLGTGMLKCKVIAYIPDADFEDKTRTEVTTIGTNIRILK